MERLIRANGRVDPSRARGGSSHHLLRGAALLSSNDLLGAALLLTTTSMLGAALLDRIGASVTVAAARPLPQ